MPRSIYSDGEEWSPEEFTSPKPVWFIRLLDKAADRTVAKHRSGASAAADPTLGRGATRGEKVANWVTQALGLATGIMAFALLVVSAGLYGDAWHVVSFSVFGVTLLLLYTIYMLYLAWRSEKGREIFLRLGRACAFLLIAGTYTPFLLVSMRGPWGWSLFCVVWALCGAGAIFQLIVGNRYRVTSTLATLFIGWMVVIAIKPVFAAVPHGGLWLLLAGGLCYTAGAFVSALRHVRYGYACRNALIIGGSTCHFLAVLLFVLPQHA
jgi:hemolysin III